MTRDAAQGPVAVTKELVQRALAIRYDDLPPHVARFAKHCLLDYVAVTIAGTREPVAAMVRAEAIEDGGHGSCSVIGSTERVTPLHAALANGVAGHALDYDDTNFTMNGHISVSSVPALLALAEAERRSGRDVIAAYVGGVDFGCRAGRLVEPGHYLKGFHATATLGALAAAAACANLLGLPSETTRHAIGLAATQAAGLKSMFGTMGKPFHAGRAAQTGLLSARLARRGFKGQLSILEADQGFASTHSPDFNTAAALSDPEGGFHVLSTLFKYHAACYGTHAAIEAGRLAREAIGNLDAIRSVSIDVGALNGDVCNIQEPRTELEARFSLRLMAAYGLTGIDTSRLDSFRPEIVLDSNIVALRDKVSVVLRDEYFVTFARMTVTLANGSSQVFDIECGVPATDLERQEQRLIGKFRSLVGPHLGEARTDALLERMLAFEEIDDFGVLVALWTPEEAGLGRSPSTASQGRETRIDPLR